MSAADRGRIDAEIRAAVWSFHAADTARNADAVIHLLWPDFEMLADGTRQSYADVAAGSRTFMGGLASFQTEWTDLRVSVLSPVVAVSSLLFRDSITTRTGELIRSVGTTTFVWQRRGDEWKLVFADATHRPVNP